MNDNDKAQKAAEIAGIDLGQFMRDVAAMDPYCGNHHCIFCEVTKPNHRNNCNWLKLRAAVSK